MDCVPKICGIYKITSPTDKVYIGQSIDIYNRWNKHKKSIRYENKKRNTAIYNSLKKHGVDAHKFEVIQSCPEQQLNELEKQWVDFYNSFNSELGLNSRDGGGSRGKFNEATKLKLSLSHKGKPSPKKGKASSKPAWNKGLVGVNKAWNKGKRGIYSEESIKKMSLSKLNKPMPKETRQKISSTLKNRVFSEEHKDNLRKSAINRYKQLNQ